MEEIQAFCSANDDVQALNFLKKLPYLALVWKNLKDKKTLWYVAAEKGWLESLKYLYGQRVISSIIYDKENQTIFHVALMKNHSHIIEFLGTVHSNLFASDLHRAAYFGKFEEIQSLENSSYTLDPANLPPIAYSIARGHFNATDKLLPRHLSFINNIHVKEANDLNNRLLTLALTNNHYEVSYLLVKFLIKCDFWAEENKKLIFNASLSTITQIIEIELEKNANEKQDSIKNKWLVLATSYGKPKTFVALANLYLKLDSYVDITDLVENKSKCLMLSGYLSVAIKAGNLNILEDFFEVIPKIKPEVDLLRLHKNIIESAIVDQCSSIIEKLFNWFCDYYACTLTGLFQLLNIERDLLITTVEKKQNTAAEKLYCIYQTRNVSIPSNIAIVALINGNDYFFKFLLRSDYNFSNEEELIQACTNRSKATGKKGNNVDQLLLALIQDSTLGASIINLEYLFLKVMEKLQDLVKINEISQALTGILKKYQDLPEKIEKSVKFKNEQYKLLCLQAVKIIFMQIRILLGSITHAQDNALDARTHFQIAASLHGELQKHPSLMVACDLEGQLSNSINDALSKGYADLVGKYIQVLAAMLEFSPDKLTHKKHHNTVIKWYINKNNFKKAKHIFALAEKIKIPLLIETEMVRKKPSLTLESDFLSEDYLESLIDELMEYIFRLKLEFYQLFPEKSKAQSAVKSEIEVNEKLILDVENIIVKIYDAQNNIGQALMEKFLLTIAEFDQVYGQYLEAYDNFIIRIKSNKEYLQLTDQEFTVLKRFYNAKLTLLYVMDKPLFLITKFNIHASYSTKYTQNKLAIAECKTNIHKISASAATLLIEKEEVNGKKKKLTKLPAIKLQKKSQQTSSKPQNTSVTAASVKKPIQPPTAKKPIEASGKLVPSSSKAEEISAPADTIAKNTSIILPQGKSNKSAVHAEVYKSQDNNIDPNLQSRIEVSQSPQVSAPVIQSVTERLRPKNIEFFVTPSIPTCLNNLPEIFKIYYAGDNKIAKAFQLFDTDLISSLAIYKEIAFDDRDKNAVINTFLVINYLELAKKIGDSNFSNTLIILNTALKICIENYQNYLSQSVDCNADILNCICQKIVGIYIAMAKIHKKIAAIGDDEVGLKNLEIAKLLLISAKVYLPTKDLEKQIEKIEIKIAGLISSNNMSLSL